MTSFGFESTTDDVLEGVDLTGTRVLVTGASAGLGVETTRALAAHGASVTMAVRDLGKGAAAIEETVYAATSPDLDGQGGVYLEDCHIGEPTDDPTASAGVRAYALDPKMADALWELSERLVG